LLSYHESLHVFFSPFLPAFFRVPAARDPEIYIKTRNFISRVCAFDCCAVRSRPNLSFFDPLSPRAGSARKSFRHHHAGLAVCASRFFDNLMHERDLRSVVLLVRLERGVDRNSALSAIGGDPAASIGFVFVAQVAFDGRDVISH
jgi:hypothetical protein